MTNFIVLSALAYLSGSVSAGHLIEKIKNVDLSKIGSKSYTSTNVSRALGWRWAIVSAVIDFSKATLPVWLALNYLQDVWQITIVAILPTIGHIYPVYYKFKGGKGISTFFGSCLALISLKNFLPIFLVWLVFVFLLKKMGLVNIIFPWLLVVVFYFLFPQYFAFALLETVIVNFAFRDNIKRLLAKEEPETSFKL